MPQSNLEKSFGDRLITLSDGRPGLRGGLHITATQSKDHSNADMPDCLDFMASDETIDRYDEVVSAAGWKLDNYHKNPVFQNSHRYGDVMFTLGKALVTTSMQGGLYQRVQFATAVNPMAKIAHGLYKGGYLNAVSVGFIPLAWEPGAAGSGISRRYTSQELLEVSAVSIPANPNALVMGLKSGAIEESDLRECLDIVRAWFGSLHMIKAGNTELLSMCADMCRECAEECDECEQADGISDDCLNACRDCAKTCRECATECDSGSDAKCAQCASACDRCAEMCDQESAAKCKVCAAVCRECAKMCRMDKSASLIALSQQPKAAPDTNTRALGAEGNDAQLLQLARTLRAVLS